MTSFVTSVDGTRIAFDRRGRGDLLVLVGGMFSDRRTIEPLARELSKRFTVITYDRRGRGDSGDAPPYAVEHEIEDLACLIRDAGGSAAVYGHSSGAGLALRAAAAGLPVTTLVLHEPPYGADDERSRAQARALACGVRRAIDAGRHAEAIALFLRASGSPPDVVDEACRRPDMLAIARTMPYDFAVMGDDEGGTIPIELVRAIDVPTLLLAGGTSASCFRDAATRIVRLLDDGHLVVLGGRGHDAPADVVAPVVTDFVTTVLRVRQPVRSFAAEPTALQR